MTSSRKAITALELPPRPRRTVYPAPFASRVAGRDKRVLGDFFGLTNFGINLTTLEPGAASALRHWHARQDEFIYVLAGTPTLIMDAGETVLSPGMCIGFKAGQADGHHLVNRSATDVLYLEIGDRAAGDAVTYPDDDIQAVATGVGSWQILHKDGSPY